MKNAYEKMFDSHNPLIEAIGKYVRFGDWPGILDRNPLHEVDFGSLDDERKDFFIELSHKRFASTATAVEVADALQTMVRTSYQLRNPTLPEQRRRLGAIAAQRGKPLSAVTVGDPIVYGKLIKGITGMGKTDMVERAVSPFQQVCVHERCDAAGWIRHVQITYLIVQMRSTRGGLLYAILEAIDGLAGTNYRKEYSNSRAWTVDKLFVEVGVLLALHSVGVLIIEEIQVRNFAMSPYREELLLFFLLLLNEGIPLVLVGNPLGFERLDEFSQDLRRLSRSDPVELHPFPSADDEDWDRGIAPGLWDYGSTKGSVPYKQVKQKFWRHSGGIPGFGAMVANGTLRLALRAGVRSMEHLDSFISDSPRLRMNRDLIDGFANKDPLKLSRYMDVPWEQYAVRWGFDLEEILSLGKDIGTQGTGQLDDEDKKAHLGIHALLRAKLARDQTRKSARKAKDAAAQGKAGPGDLRGAKDKSRVLAKGLDELKEELEAEGA